ncbi:MAG TPA: hypothetical protein VET69_12580, partial [Terriglobales bacterium]|nr:hypothetical protein [Terriglobales bacterium]
RPNFANPPADFAVAIVSGIAAAAAPLTKLQQDALAQAKALHERLIPQLKTRQDPSDIQDEQTLGQYLTDVKANLHRLSAGVRANDK